MMENEYSPVQKKRIFRTKTVCKSEHRVNKVISSLYRNEVWVSVSKLDVDVEQMEELEGVIRVAKLNIINRIILDYDRANLNYDNDLRELESYRDEEYHPYFTNFIVYIDKTGMQQLNRLRELGTRWFKARLMYIDKSVEYRDISTSALENDLFWGELESSASPIKYSKRLLRILPEELDGNTVEEIFKTYDIPEHTDDNDVKDKLNRIFSNVTLTSSRVYSIGNGNLIQIGGSKCLTMPDGQESSKDFQMMYDVGYHQRSQPNENRMAFGPAVRNFHEIIPDVVCLSHWDDDHIMGCSYAQKELYDCDWFAPEISEDKYRNRIGDRRIEISAVRLAVFLEYRKKLTIIKRDCNTARKLVEVINGTSRINFYMGKNKSNNGITKENCGGLVIEIINDDGKGGKVENLFCGDVPYEVLKDVVWDKRSDGYANLLVPHHGSKMTYSALKTSNAGTATISATGVTRVDRPNYEHREKLIDNGSGYKVQVTGESKALYYNLKLI